MASITKNSSARIVAQGSSALRRLQSSVVAPFAGSGGAMPIPMYSSTQLGGNRFGIAHQTTQAAATKPRVDVNLPQGSPMAMNEEKENLGSLSDDRILELLESKLVPLHRLEKELGDATRAVAVRRKFVVRAAERAGIAEAVKAMEGIPISRFSEDFFYKSIENTNCEQVIGYMPLPVGVVGPLRIDGVEYQVPMATTEGALVASTCRGARAILEAGGCTTALNGDGMTRAPVIRMESITSTGNLKNWIETPENYKKLEAAFNSTSRFGRLQTIDVVTAGRNVYLRCKCRTGDAMGMNMITKGVHQVLETLREEFPEMKVLALSGNLCTDKKPSAINWIQGRGKSVTAEVHLTEEILRTVLKTNADALIELNTSKNLIGSAMAGSIGGFNAHASNIVTAVFLATGQDAAQNVESSTCLTLFEKDESGKGVYASVTMPSIEVGTVGGGTSLPAQAAALQLLGVRGASKDEPGSNSRQLAKIVASTVLAGELSLMAALTSGDLLSAHIKLNRKQDTPAVDVPVNGHTQTVRTGPSVHAHSGPGGGVGAFRVPEAAVAAGRRHFAAPSAALCTHDCDPRLSVP